MPDSLAGWKNETLAAIGSGAPEEQLQNLIVAIDDKLFSDLSDEEMTYLDNVMASAEQANSQSKTIRKYSLISSHCKRPLQRLAWWVNPTPYPMW